MGENIKQQRPTLCVSELEEELEEVENITNQSICIKHLDKIPRFATFVEARDFLTPSKLLCC